MAPNKRARKAARRAQGAGVPRPAAPAILGDWQRRVVLMLLFSGLAFGAVGAFVTPRGTGYWLAIAAAAVSGTLLGFVLGGAPARALESQLMRTGEPRDAPRLPGPMEAPPQLRAALQVAVLPVFFSELASAAERMTPRARAASLALVEAGATAPESKARQALAEDLPRLIVALTAGDEAGIREAETRARRLAQPTP